MCGCGKSYEKKKRKIGRKSTFRRRKSKKLAFKKGPRGGTTRVSSLWFSNTNFKRSDARKWMKKNGYKPIKKSIVEEKPNYIIYKIARHIAGARYRTIYLDKKRGVLARIMVTGPAPKN